ncbi:jg18016 [Pararge aegeria aegeria]|uniref:Jg18016 protein n=1 Tax=Pararge aegeria aegeria TaxID=348720 RepID=A0A8S4RK73_9NEOP|nr:jg18016 [Pararge aegeria aegeria]
MKLKWQWTMHIARRTNRCCNGNSAPINAAFGGQAPTRVTDDIKLNRREPLEINFFDFDFELYTIDTKLNR